jgi:cytochrome c-type biogenesis protein
VLHWLDAHRHQVLEGRGAAAKIAEVCIFMLTRALFMGVLGLAAVVVGSAFIGFQKAAWMLLGALFAGIGLVFLAGRAGWLMASIGPHLPRIAPAEGPVLMGLLFGLNIPACAAPLLLALLGAAAAGGATGNPYSDSLRSWHRCL